MHLSERSRVLIRQRLVEGDTDQEVIGYLVSGMVTSFYLPPG